MFQCMKCNDNKYLKYEEYLYCCKDCNKMVRLCCDCEITDIGKDNLPELKQSFTKLFRFIIDIDNILNRLHNFPIDILNNIKKYLPGNILYYSIHDNKNYYITNFPNDILYIKPFGLQLKNDDNSKEFYSTPIFYCIKCSEKYNYFCLNRLKLIL